ncbi:MAG: Methyltransferase type 11 [Candidatus Collierbacteria bacterium GW2011_GWE1_46_18]|uniref:Methyltransferase type 11 n=1 Tax=Candidatus Collierbacteria bacterium GW2011_GWE1_46_18 TaxID=1618399 RepID=A0A0G1PAY9_9BACT|nr:MAG: Methyltransferase type 11 [Candidatus Collierbacteria bacterium GW2011_GWE1_46_18]HBD95958.1 hypothetical protein [Spirochaetia bacterium]
MSNDNRLWTYYETQKTELFDSCVNRYKIVYKIVTQLIPLHKRILEIGFGAGQLLDRLSSDYDCVGVDISPLNVKQISKRIKGVEFKYYSERGKLPFNDNSFDAIIASEVLEHMDDSQLTKTIKEAIRVIKKKGYFIVTVPAEENIINEQIFCPNCKHTFHRWGHKQSWNIPKIESIFKDFEKIHVSEVFVKYPGKNIPEIIISNILYVLRTCVNRFHKISGRTYIIIAQK